jgi:Flp pilus assembly protein TadD
MIRSKKTLDRSRIASVARNQPNQARAALMDALRPNRPSARFAAIAAMLVASGCASTQVSYSGMDAPGLRAADEALRLGSTQLALQVSDSVLRAAPSNASAMEIKADALAQMGKTEEAAALFQTLLSQNPDSIRANIGMGRIKLLTDASVAEPLFRRVLRQDPKNLTALNNLGIAQDLLGRHDEAQATYRQALDLNPNLESAVVNLSLSLAMSGRGTEAMQLLGPKARAPEASAKLKQDYASVLSMSGHKTEAERFLAQNMTPDGVRQVLDSVSPTHSQAIADFAPPTAETRQMASAAPMPAPAVAQPAITASAVSSMPLPPPEAAVRAAVTPVAPAAVAMPPVTARTAQMPAVATPGETAAAQPTSLADVLSSDTIDNDPGPAVIVPAVIAMPAPVAQPSAPAPLPTVHSAQTPDLSSQGAFPTMASPSGALLGAAMTAPDAGSAAVSSVPLPAPSYVTAMPAPFATPVVTRPVTPLVAPAVAPVAPVAPVTPVTPAAAHPAPVPAPSPVHTVSATAAESAPAPVPAPQAKADVAPRTTLALATGDARHMPAAAAVTATTSTPSGTAVQFTAATSEEAAHALWNTLVKKFPAELGHREAVVIRVEAGKNVFFRLRTVGFDSTADARGLCSHMRAAGQACFVPGA